MQLPFDLLTLNHLLIPFRGLQTWLGSLRRGSSGASALILFGNGMLSTNSLTLSAQSCNILSKPLVLLASNLQQALSSKDGHAFCPGFQSVLITHLLNEADGGCVCQSVFGV